MIERYQPNPSSTVMYERATGEWVSYSDHRDEMAKSEARMTVQRVKDISMFDRATPSEEPDFISRKHNRRWTFTRPGLNQFCNAISKTFGVPEPEFELWFRHTFEHASFCEIKIASWILIHRDSKS